MRRGGWFAALLVVATLAVTSPAFASAPTPDGAGGTRRPTLRHVDAIATGGAALASPERTDRRDAPVGWSPVGVAPASIALAGVVVIRPGRRSTRNPFPSFRRRAPPLLPIAS
jgi:hypothetical protein